MAPATEQDYFEIFREVNRFACSWPDFSWDYPKVADSMLVGLFDDRALDGVHAGWSGKVFSAIGYFLPEYSGAMRAMLPRAKAAQAEWKKLTPNRSRLPIPFELVTALFHLLVLMGCWESGLIVLLCFSLYLRPSEPHRLKCSQVIPPGKGVSGSRHVTVVLNPVEDGRASKLHEYDELLLVDSPLLPALGEALLRHARGRPPLEPSKSSCRLALSSQPRARAGVASCRLVGGHLARHATPEFLPCSQPAGRAAGLARQGTRARLARPSSVRPAGGRDRQHHNQVLGEGPAPGCSVAHPSSHGKSSALVDLADSLVVESRTAS